MMPSQSQNGAALKDGLACRLRRDRAQLTRETGRAPTFLAIYDQLLTVASLCPPLELRLFFLLYAFDILATLIFCVGCLSKLAAR